MYLIVVYVYCTYNTKSLTMSIMQLEFLIAICNKYFVGAVYAFIYTFSCTHFTIVIALMKSQNIV